MTYQIVYYIGKTKNNNTEHQVEVEADDVFMLSKISGQRIKKLRCFYVYRSHSQLLGPLHLEVKK